jgi:hypothetical protein
MVTTYTFEAPGLADGDLRRYGVEVRSSVMIVNFRRGSDPFGTIGDHVGTIELPDADPKLALTDWAAVLAYDWARLRYAVLYLVYTSRSNHDMKGHAD